jgi:hypothetical protein
MPGNTVINIIILSIAAVTKRHGRTALPLPNGSKSPSQQVYARWLRVLSRLHSPDSAVRVALYHCADLNVLNLAGATNSPTPFISLLEVRSNRSAHSKNSRFLQLSVGLPYWSQTRFQTRMLFSVG